MNDTTVLSWVIEGPNGFRVTTRASIGAVREYILDSIDAMAGSPGRKYIEIADAVDDPYNPGIYAAYENYDFEGVRSETVGMSAMVTIDVDLEPRSSLDPLI